MGPRVLREDLVPLPLGPPQEELLAPPEQDLGGPVLAPGLQRLLHNLSFSFKGHRLVTSEAKGDETSGMYVVLSTQLKLLVLNIIYSIYLRMHKGSLDGFDLIPNMLRKY